MNMNKMNASPERAAQPRLKETLKALYTDHPLQSPKPVLKQWSQGSERPFPTDREGIRLELIGISAFFIQKIWQSAEGIIAAHPPGASELIVNEQTHAFHRAPDIDRQRLNPFLGQTPEEAMEVIDGWMGKTLILGMREVWDGLERDDKEPVPSWDLKAFHRYQQLLTMSNKPDPDPADHIRRGILVALRVVGSYFAHVGQAFQARERRPITAAEARQILANSAQTIRVTAGMFVNTLNELDDLMWDSPDEKTLYAPDSIVLVGQGDELRLEPAPHLHMQLSRLPEVPGQRTGCPALAAKGKDGKSVIDGLLDWHMSMADEFYFPRLEEFMKNAEIRRRAGV